MDPLPLQTPLSGVRIDSWLLQEPTGGGSFGIVYRAVHIEDATRTAAVKVAKNPQDTRFEREAALLERIDHPHVPRLLGIGSCAGHRGQATPYIVMSWAEGVCLYDWARIRHRPLTSREVLRLLAQVARALEAIHAAGGVHRDVKGDNVRVSPEGHTMLLDFGACWLRGARPLTGAELPPGTEPYRSPQLLRIRRRWERGLEAHYEARWEDDIYALGVMAYYLLTGEYPPPATDPDYTHEDLGYEKMPPLRPPCARVVVASLLEDLVLRCLSVAREARPSARQLACELEQAVVEAGAEADRLVVRNPEESRPMHVAPPVPPKVPPEHEPSRWPGGACLVGVGLLLLAPIVLLGRFGRDEPERTSAWSVRTEPDAGTSGLGEEALASKAELPFADWEPQAGITRQMPLEPLEGQQRPPCEPRSENAINGGCWVKIAEMKAPCGPKAFEYEGQCYYPVSATRRKPTSDGKDAR